MTDNLKATLKQRVETLLKDDKQKTGLLMAVGIAGMLLLGLSSWLPDSGAQLQAAQPQEISESEYAQQIEAKLEELITGLSGAGKTTVMVTLAASEETVYATDSETGDNSYRQTHILLDNSATPALVKTVYAPQIQGVAVLCEGGDSITVQANITEIVKVLTGVGANNITVGKLA